MKKEIDKRKYKIGSIVKNYELLDYDKKTKRYVCKCVNCGTICQKQSGEITRKTDNICKGCYNIVGKKIGKFTIIKSMGKDSQKQNIYLCKCECGNEFIKKYYSIMKNNEYCSNCYSKYSDIKNEKYYKDLYKLWKQIKARVSLNYKYQKETYKKITICEEWRNDFKSFYVWALDNGYKMEKLPNGLNKWTIDRIDNNGDYSPKNCRFVTNLVQANNKSNIRLFNYNGENLSIPQIARIECIKSDKLYYRLVTKGDSLSNSIMILKEKQYV